jgi:hypothetical protein
MDRILRKWNCRNCGRSNEIVVAPDATVKCEYCSDIAPIKPRRVPRGETLVRSPNPSAALTIERRQAESASPVLPVADEAQRRQVVARLRERYGEARDLASPTEAHANLEWIIGARRNLGQDEAALDRTVAELVVLWLEDLAVGLDIQVPSQRAAEADESEISTTPSRQAVVHGLRAATREFAVAFLGPY